MKNSHLLLIAVALCVLNAAGAFWASVSSSALRGRVLASEQELKTLAGRLEASVGKLEKQLQDESQRVKRLEDRVFAPPTSPEAATSPGPAASKDR